MPDFRYTAHDKDGRTVSAVAAASDRIALARNLRDEGLIVYRAVELTKLSREHLKERLNIFFSRIKYSEFGRLVDNNSYIILVHNLW